VETGSIRTASAVHSGGELAFVTIPLGIGGVVVHSPNSLVARRPGARERITPRGPRWRPTKVPPDTSPQLGRSPGRPRPIRLARGGRSARSANRDGASGNAHAGSENDKGPFAEKRWSGDQARPSPEQKGRPHAGRALSQPGARCAKDRRSVRVDASSVQRISRPAA
jgi:hypothetical protein